MEAARRVQGPTASGSGGTRDWRAGRLGDQALQAAREDARVAIGAALTAAGGASAADGAAVARAWAAAELALQRCLELALARVYEGVPRPPARALLDDLAARDPRRAALLTRLLTAPEARTRYVFLEDLLADLDDR